MLKQLRNKKTAKKVWVVLAIIIVPAFVLWGSAGLMRNRGESGNAGRIFGRDVSLLEYKDAMLAVKNMALIQFGENFQEMQKYLNLEEQAWERLILLYEAKRRKFSANDKEVVEAIEKYPFFQRKGQFDDKIYAEMLRYVFRVQPRTFEEEVRENLILSKLFKQETDKVTTSEEEVKKEYRKANEEISLYYLAALYADFAKNINISDEEAREYFTKNSLDFKQPLSFNLEYAVSDSQEAMNKLRENVNRNSDFAKLAKDAGLEAKETGLFAQTDPIPGVGWSPEILGFIGRLKIGDFTPLIAVEKKYYLLRLKEKKEAYIPDFEKVEDKVKESLSHEKASGKAKENAQACLMELKKQYQINPKLCDFNRLAAEFTLKNSSTDPFKFGSYIEGIGASDPFWLAALDLKEDEFSEIIQAPTGFYIIKVKSRIPIDEKKFESEKKEFTEKVLLGKKQERFGMILEDLKRKALNL
ncbi:MAG TPA: SurA N-terminal domain-containing protein [Candidatus Margulisiibacteriota bacterium]|nr:SurA N-terminal domain-containing protein [Candidatus Margulisiibacteriota bacterium]